METKLTSLSRRYQAALLRHLQQGPQAGLRSADGLGREALDLGLDPAKIHEQALVALMAPNHSFGAKDGLIKRAQTFFVEALTRIEETHRAAMAANVRLSQLNAGAPGNRRLRVGNRKRKFFGARPWRRLSRKASCITACY